MSLHEGTLSQLHSSSVKQDEESRTRGLAHIRFASTKVGTSAAKLIGCEYDRIKTAHLHFASGLFLIVRHN